MLYRITRLLLVGVDPVDEVGHLGVNTGVIGEGAATTPRNDTVLDSVGTSASEERAARVTLAGVNATAAHVTSAQHRSLDRVRVQGTGVSSVTGRVGDDWDIDTAKKCRDRATRAGGAPSTDGNDGTGWWVEKRSWQTNRRSRWNAQVQRSAHIDEGNVVLLGVGVVALMHLVAADIAVLFQAADTVQIVFTSNDAEDGDIGDAIDAVSSVQDSTGSQDGATAGLRETTKGAAALERNLEGKGVGRNDRATDDLVFGDGLELAIEKNGDRVAGQDHALALSNDGERQDGGKSKEPSLS